MFSITPRLSRTLESLRNPDFRFLWLSSAFSLASRSMQSTLLAWLVLDITDSPFHVALVGVFGWTPLLLLGMIGGTLADSLDRKRVFAATLTMSLATVFIFAIILVVDSVQIWHAYLTIFITGSCYVLGMPSRRSLFHDIVGRERVTNAVALDNLGQNASAILGPAIAGFLIVAWGVASGYLVLTLLFCSSLLLLCKLKVHRREYTPLRFSQVPETLITALKYVGTQNALMATVLIAFLVNLTVTPYVNMTPVIARDVLHVDPILMGLLLSSHGLGALIGSILIASMSTIKYHGRVYMTASMLLLIAVFAFSLSRSYLLSIFIVLIAGLGNAGFNTMQMSLTMLLPKDKMRGSALGIMSLGVGAGPLGMLITGLVASSLGAANAVTINATVGVIGLALIALLIPSLRWQTSSDNDTRPSSPQFVTES